MISLKSTLFLLSTSVLVFATDSRVQAAPASGVVNVGASMESVICPAKADDVVEVYDQHVRPTGLRLKAYEPVKLFQGWGENTKVLRIGASTWKLVRVQLPKQTLFAAANVYVYEGSIAPLSVCQQRIAPRIPIDLLALTQNAPATANKAAPSDGSDVDEGEEAEEGSQEEDAVPTIIGTVATGVSNLLMGLDSPNCCLMPIETKPNSYLVGMGRFGWGRPGRIHAGVDLYGRNGQKVRAVAAGEVIRAPYYFKKLTMGIDVRHTGGFIVRYGELTPFGSMSVGTAITRGQQVGSMKKLACCEPMLHMEMYSGAASGALTRKHVGKYWRRSDLVDPTKYVTKWPLK